MIAPDYGIKAKSFVGTYHIEKYDDIEYIVSEECYPAYEGEKELRQKTLFIEDFKNNDYLLLALANVDISKDKEIIAYCNEYGLPISRLLKNADTGIFESIPVTNEAIEEPEEDYYELLLRKDNMPKEFFCKYVINIRHIMNLKNGIENENYDLNMLSSLGYILLFNNMWKREFEEDEPKPETITGKFSYFIQSFFHSDLSKKFTNKKQKNNNIGISFIQEALMRNYTIIMLSMDLKVNADKDDVPFVHNLIDFLFNKFVDTENIQYISIDSNFQIEISTEFNLSSEMIYLMKKIAARVLADMVTEGVKDVRPLLSIDENGGYYADWNFSYQYEGLFMELFIMCSSAGIQVRKCKKSTCGHFFPANIRNKIYCSRECALADAKRRQRERDRADPNRERLSPGFKNRHKKKTYCN